MLVELLRLKLQLENLKILYEEARSNNAGIEELKQIKDHIQITEVLIADRKDLIRKNENRN